MIYTKICKNRHLPTALLTFGVGIAISLSVYILPAYARQSHKIDKETPGEFSKIQDETGKSIESKDGNIFKYLDNTKCGGWLYKNKEAIDPAEKYEGVEGKIAEIIDTPEGTESDVPLGNDITIIPASLNPPPGLPGRKGKWDGNIPSGMALRDDKFHYPYAAEGYSFAHYKEHPVCDLIFTTKSAFMDPGQELCKDPNQQPPEKNAPRCNADCEFLNSKLYQYPVKRARMCRHIEYINGEPIVIDYATDDPDLIDILQCNSCLFTNDEVIKWQEDAGKKFRCTGNFEEEKKGILLVPYGWVWGDQNKSDIKIPAACFKYLVQEKTEYPNCTTCGVEDHIFVEKVPVSNKAWEKSDMTPGEECRCEGKGCGVSIRTNLNALNDLQIKRPPRSPDPSPRTVDYKSFYRQYLGVYKRDKLNVNEDDGAKKGEEDEIITKEGHVGCYAWYGENIGETPKEEFDPLTTPHTDEKQFCVIDIYGKDRDETLKDQMRKTQNIRGAYGQVSKYNKPDPNDPAEERNQRKNTDKKGNLVKCDEEDIEKKNLWCPKLSGGLSLLDEKVFDEKLEKNLSLALLNLDSGAEKATVQLSAEKPLAEHSLMRAFDDTVVNEKKPTPYQPGKPTPKPSDRRTIAEWWQEQETEANTLFSPPMVRLILPAKWVAGLDPSDPLFNPESVVIDRNRDSRTQAIEVQIKAREDLVGEVAAYLERSLLFEITEEPIPIVLPMASPTELRSLATQWCTWWVAKENTGKKDEEKITNCDGAPAKIDALRKRLEEYANRIEETRRLRSELAHYLGRILESQRLILEPIILWFEQNVTAYQNFLEEHKKLFAGDENAPDEGLFPLWQKIQKTLWEFHDSVNFPWCMNQRFTTSVYSFLDPWMPGRWKEPVEMDGGRRCTESNTGSADPANRYPYCLPVLKLNGESIPRATDAVFDLSLFSGSTTPLSIPVLKPILLKIDETKLAPRPGEDIPELPELPGIEPIRNLMRNEKTIEKLFPKSETRSAPTVMQAPNFLSKEDRSHLKTMMKDIKAMLDAMTGAYRTFWESLKSHERIECTGASCVHVEMDLIERFTRIGSRPAVHLKEDFDSKGSPRTDPNTCPPNDYVCLYLNHEKRYPKEGWQIILPKKDPQKELDVIQKLREEARTVTLPPPIGEQDSKLFEFYDTNMSDLLPPFDIPGSLDLTPYPDLVPPEEP